MEHDKFVCGKEIKNKMDLIDHIDFLILQRFYKGKHDDIPQ